MDRFYCPEHEYNPPERSGLCFCPYCEFPEEMARAKVECGTKPVRVRVPAHLSHTGEARFAEKEVDACIADIVEALVAAGLYTDGCCCGHGRDLGNIVLSDGRVLNVAFPDDWEVYS